MSSKSHVVLSEGQAIASIFAIFIFATVVLYLAISWLLGIPINPRSLIEAVKVSSQHSRARLAAFDQRQKSADAKKYQDDVTRSYEMDDLSGGGTSAGLDGLKAGGMKRVY